MDGDRKYRQHGYQDAGGGGHNGQARNEPRERFQPPRHPMDITAPRLPRMVQNVTASRCASCSTTLAAGHDFLAPCPKCGADLHCCRQCEHFEPSTRFQCTKPIAERVAYKDKANQCELFHPRVTVAREATRATPNPPPARPAPVERPSSFSRQSSEARTAFENLFKK